MTAVVDSSALLAVLLGEPDAEQIADQMNDLDLIVPASVLVEAFMVAVNRGLESKLQRLIELLGAEIVALDEPIARRAIAAYKAFGKGRHKANLNFGDCLAYATAKRSGWPLLFKGDDFSRTDVERVGAWKR